MENAKECLLDKDEVEQKCREYAYYKKYLSALPGGHQLPRSPSWRFQQLDLVCNSSREEGDKAKAGKLTPRRRRRRKLLEALHLGKGQKCGRRCDGAKSSTEKDSSGGRSSSDGAQSKCSGRSRAIRKTTPRKAARQNVRPLQKPEIKVEDWSEVKSCSSETPPPARARVLEKGVLCSGERPPCSCFMCKIQERCSVRYLWVVVLMLFITVSLGYAAFFYLKMNLQSIDIPGRGRLYFTTSYNEELPFYGADIPHRTKSASLLGLEEEQGPIVKVVDFGSNRFADEGRAKGNIEKYDGQVPDRSAKETWKPNRRRISVNVWRYRDDRDTGHWVDNYKHVRNQMLLKRHFLKHQQSLHAHNNRFKPEHFQKRRYNYEINKDLPFTKGHSKNNGQKLNFEYDEYSKENSYGGPENMDNEKIVYKKINENRKLHTYEHSNSNNIKKKMAKKLLFIENENKKFDFDSMSNDTKRNKNQKSVNNDTFPPIFLAHSENSRPNERKYVVRICDSDNEFSSHRRHRKPLLHTLIEKVFGRCYPVCCEKKKCCGNRTLKFDPLARNAKNVSIKCPCDSECSNFIRLTKNTTLKPKRIVEYPIEFYSYKKPFPFSNNTMGSLSKIRGENFYDSFDGQSKDNPNQFIGKSDSRKKEKDITEMNDFSKKFISTVNKIENTERVDELKFLREIQRSNQNSLKDNKMHEKKLFQLTDEHIMSTVQPRVTTETTSEQHGWDLKKINRKLLSYDYSSRNRDNENENDVAYDSSNVDDNKALAGNEILKDSNRKEAEITKDETNGARNIDVNVVGTSRGRMSKQYRNDDKYEEEASDIARWGTDKRQSEIDDAEDTAISNKMVHNGKRISNVDKNNDKADVRNEILGIENSKKADQDGDSSANGRSEDEFGSRGETSDDERLRAEDDSLDVNERNEANIADEDDTNVLNGIKNTESKNKMAFEHRSRSENDKSNKAVMSHRERIISINKRPCKHKASIRNEMTRFTDNNDEEEVDNDQNYKLDIRNEYHKLRKSLPEDENSDSENSKEKRSSVKEKLSGIALSHDGDVGRISREGIRIFGRHDKPGHHSYNRQYKSDTDSHVHDEEISMQNREDDEKFDTDHQGDMPSNKDKSNVIYNRPRQFHNIPERERTYIRNRKRYDLKKLPKNSNDYWSKQSNMQKFKTIDIRNDFDEKDGDKSKHSSSRVAHRNGLANSEESGSTDEENVSDKKYESQKALELAKKSETSTDGDMEMDFDQLTTKSDQTSTVSEINNLDRDVNLNAQDYSDYGVLHDTRMKAVSDGVAGDPRNAAVMSVVVHKSYGTVDVNGMKRLRAREERITYLPHDKKLITGERNANKLLATLHNLQPIANKTILYDRLISYPEAQNRNAKRDATNPTYSFNDICKKIVEYKIQQNMAKKRNQKTKSKDNTQDSLYLTDLTDSNKIEDDNILDPDVRFRVRSLLSVKLDSEESNVTMKSFDTFNNTIMVNTTNQNASIHNSTDKFVANLSSTSNQGLSNISKSTILNLNRNNSENFQIPIEKNDQIKMAAQNLTATCVTLPSTTASTVRQNISDEVDLKKVVKRNAHWDWDKKPLNAVTKRIHLKAARDYAKFVRLKLKMERFNAAKSAESMLNIQNVRGEMQKKRQMPRRYRRRSFRRRRRFRRPTRVIKRNAVRYFDLGDNNFERPAFMKRPDDHFEIPIFTERAIHRQSTSAPAFQASDDEIIQEALTGQRSARIVDQILQEARNDHYLNTMFGENQRMEIPAIPSLAEYVGMTHIEDVNVAARFGCTKPGTVATPVRILSPSTKSEHLLGDIEVKLLQLIEQQVRVRTCLKLPPELEKFLRELTCTDNFVMRSARLLPRKLNWTGRKHADAGRHNLTSPGAASTADRNRN